MPSKFQVGRPVRTTRRRLRRRRTTTRFRRRTNRIVRSRYTPPSYSFKRVCRLGTLVVPANSITGYVGANQYFTLSLLPNYTEFTTLFDQYMIAGIKWRITCRPGMTTLVESSINNKIGMPRICLARDYDGNPAAPTNDSAWWDACAQYGRARVTAFTDSNRVFQIYIRPSVSLLAYKTSGTTVGYKPAWKQWIDCDYSDVQHYGLIYSVQVPFTGASVGVDVYFDIDATFYLRTKNPR